MTFWADVERLQKQATDALRTTEAELKALGFHHVSITEYGVWKATHRLKGWVTARTGPELVEAAKRKLGEP